MQVIKRARTQQWYICFPSALAQAMEFTKSEEVEWVIESEHKLILKRKTRKKRERLIGGKRQG